MSAQDLETTKRQKSTAKSAFTRVKNQLLDILDEDLPSRTLIKSTRSKLNETQERVIGILETLSKGYSELNDNEKVQATNIEMDKINSEYDEVQIRCQEYLDARKDELSSVQSSVKHQQIEDWRNKQYAMDMINIRHEFEQREQELVRKQKEMEESFKKEQRELYSQLETERKNFHRAEQEAKEEMERQMDQELRLVQNNSTMGINVCNNSNQEFNVCKSGLFNSSPSRTQDLDSTMIGKDMWKQLQRVSIPVFSGDKRNYQSWKAAFVACIDQAPATKEYKLLQLRQYLKGDALRVIENLGHSGVAYEAAKERLERKYGGQRRQIALYIEELENFPPLRDSVANDLEKFADLLDIAVVNLKEAGRDEELKNGSLYNKLQRKMTESMLSRYQRWIYEKRKEESVNILREWILQESEFQTIASETIHGLSAVGSGSEKSKKGSYGNRKDNRTFFGESQVDQKPQKRDSKLSCELCNKPHGVWRCDQFNKQSVHDRWETAKRLQLCYRCLGSDHVGKHCRRSRTCNLFGCKEVHHRLLHRSKITGANKTVESRSNLQSVDKRDENSNSDLIRTRTDGESKDRTFLVGREKKNVYVTLRTVPVILRNGSRSVTVNALLDDASTKTYLNADVAAELGLQGSLEKVTVNVLNDNIETFETMPVEFELQSINGRTRSNVSAYTTQKVTGNLKPINWSKHSRSWDHLAGIKFPDLGERPCVDILIGLDHLDLHYSYRDIRGRPGEPIARLTPLGWTCVGNPSTDSEQTLFNRTYFVRNTDNDLEALVKRFWETEDVQSPRSEKLLNQCEKIALDKVKETVKFVDGRYQVGVPWKNDAPEMPDNYSMAMRRLENTEKRLKRDPKIASSYIETIDSYIDKGYVRKVEGDIVETSNKWYLPHFAVVREDKDTTKTRIVFDASAKFSGISLNDAIYQGPKLQRELFDVLLRFRKQPVAIVCDIAEMYLRIELPPEDKPFHRFLWRGLNTDQQPEVYEFQRVVFGVNSSPFQAQFVTQRHAQLYQDDYPMAAETILKSTYMDDSMDSVRDEEAGIELYRQLSEIWAKAGMYARKWLSNSETVLRCIPKEDRAQKVDLDEGYLPSVKTLGVLWCADDDEFTFKANPPDMNFKFTKRNILSKVATLFDPLGFLAPYTIRAKMLLQDIWSAGFDWDETLDGFIEEKAVCWFNELDELSQLRIPRCLRLPVNIDETTVHVFVDASTEAYGSVVYMRNKYSDGTVSVRFIAAKTRVAPLASVSVPRLELMAAVVGLRLALSVIGALELPKDCLTFWTDSMNVLYWIKGKSRDYKPFVANRLGEIHEHSSQKQWRHVPTNVNPADLLSRGRTVDQLKTDNIWWNGPDFLFQDMDCWPETCISTKIVDDCEMKRDKKQRIYASSHDQITTLTSIKRENEIEWRLNPVRYSKFNRLVRVFAWTVRFIDNCRVSRDQRRSGSLSTMEFEDAKIQIIRDAQKDAFSDEYRALLNRKEIHKNSKLLPLQPILDETGIIRCDGRLKFAEFLPFDTRYPIILPRKHWITKLIVRQFHENGKHVCGTNQTLSAISSKFWIISAREEIRDCESECYVCRKRKAKCAEQIMAPLPDIRFKSPLQAFSRTAVDFGGPFITVQGRGKRREKRYLCLFTCVLSRAVHLEMAYGLDTDSFLNAFYRMVNRRGLPKEVISDNGTNFVGANRELKELVQLIDKDKIQNAVCNQGIKWHFNPPLAPHFGGVHESMIKSAKKAVYAILGNADITDEELYTAFTGAEALINSRPLTYQSADPKDVTPLTPNHFLQGQVGGQFAPESIDTTDFSPRKRWRRVQELIRHFWQRWIREWLPTLNKRNKWTNEKRDLKVNDIVLVMNPNSARGTWPLGRILEVYPGRDGHVRVAKIKVEQTVITRPITKLCPLELNV